MAQWRAVAVEKLRAGIVRSRREAFRRALAELQSHYLIRFAPAREGECRPWRELEVRLQGVKGEVRARRGYSVACPTG